MLGWTNRKISLIAVLIATSVSFVIISTFFVPITAIPTFKLAFAGIPVKITGYFFGPIFGFITGFLTDIISFVFIPTYYHPLYSVSLGISGFIPGIVAVFYRFVLPNSLGREARVRKIGYKTIQLTACYWDNRTSEKNKNKLMEKINSLKIKLLKVSGSEYSQLYINAHFGITLVTIVGVFSIILVIFNVFVELPTTKDTVLFNTLIAVASFLIICVVVFFRFWNLTIYLGLAPIVIFSILLDYITLPVNGVADSVSTGLDMLTSIKFSLLISPVKMWSNMIILYLVFRIMAPLLEKTNQKGWI